MRIALVVPGGVDRSGEFRVIPALLALIARLAARHELQVFALAQERAHARWVLAGAEIINIGLPFTLPRAVAHLRRAHRENPFDVVQAIWAGAPGLAAVAAAKSLRIPSCVHIAGGELAALPAIGYGGALHAHWRWSNRWALTRADAVTAASVPIIEQAAALGIPASRVPLGVDLVAWPITGPKTREAGEPLRLIHVASLNRVKDQPLLLRAMQRLRHAGVDFQLEIVGEDTLQGEMQALATQLELDSAVTFHGFRTQRQLHPMMSRAHLHLVTSRHEAGPLVMLEAAVAGVPTVGTAVGHVREWADAAALAVPPGDDAALAAAILELAHDEPRRLRIAAEAQRRARAEDADFTVHALEAVYAGLGDSKAT